MQAIRVKTEKFFEDHSNVLIVGAVAVVATVSLVALSAFIMGAKRALSGVSAKQLAYRVAVGAAFGLAPSILLASFSKTRKNATIPVVWSAGAVAFAWPKILPHLQTYIPDLLTRYPFLTNL